MAALAELSCDSTFLKQVKKSASLQRQTSAPLNSTMTNWDAE